MLDHVVYATPDLESSVHDLGNSLGLVPSPGGQHLGRGTRNYLLSLGSGSYLEIVGPDPEQRDFTGARPFGVDRLERPRLVGWAMRVEDIDVYIERVKSAGYDPGPASAMSRRTPDGQILSWKLTSVPEPSTPSLLPFLIDWGATPHPSRTATQGANLVDFHCQSPNPDELQIFFNALGVTVPIEPGQNPLLSATIAGPAGTVVIK